MRKDIAIDFTATEKHFEQILLYRQKDMIRLINEQGIKNIIAPVALSKPIKVVTYEGVQMGLEDWGDGADGRKWRLFIDYEVNDKDE